MNKRVMVFFIAAGILAVLGILAYTSLEIYPRKAIVPPSREAIVNEYLALERWLSETGHPVRIEKNYNPVRIVSAPEKAVVVHASSCEWKDAEAVLLPWIKRGGFLVVILDSTALDDELAQFLASVGIVEDSRSHKEEQDEKTVPKEDDLEKILNEIMSDEIENDKNIPAIEESTFYDFDRNIRFSVAKGENITVLKDRNEIIRLARISLGAGGLAVTGKPYFMFNNYLKRDVNAALAWDLTGACALGDNSGIVFLRDKRKAKSFFGKIADRGNFLPPAASALILIIVGFWMIIPRFGLVFFEKQTRARPVRERFLAEARFLKKYGALKSYLEIYLREIKLCITKNAHDDVLNGIAEIEQALQSGMSYRNIIKSLQRLQKMMECL